ncbi:DctP family TRAP transporter solute-binding subunit [Pasteurella multocida]|uniref:DctP family TRAP transporter solute-binding subunit n=1 Tax=Pasteurella multocida TaxID=747 RepID=UPI00202110ED|nr:TRAP transporter substrate-binding protein [Pasteurella multocida]MCL7826395.1 DctP family TRAP transporter solute-binding subunit [Pasteurella multocida]URI04637.1 DctP family TRAP transporter solute-binding subunit [Pasteurella multocida]HDR1186979.1 DctP family TRAP transporter solute-binding subunit [Pasteurella multocida]HDR1315689.1 DctP family TRAP transporter solute-binding subunit [Pasteurella multocida]HDR1892245.1 DctP family TRAP transporter solute-binding subunit [Pasteurella m
MSTSLLKRLTIVASLSLLFANSILAKDLVVSTTASLGSLQYDTTKYFVDVTNQKLSEAKLDYRLNFFGSGQLGNDKDTQQKLKLGTIDIALLSSTLATNIPQMAIFELPFLITNRQQLNKIEQQVFYPFVAPEVEKKGYKIIGLWENGFRSITNNTRPINHPEDLKGLKIRTPSSSWRLKMFKAWGANPTPIPFGDVFIGLRTGVIDGQENPLTNIYAAKLQEVQKYLSITNHVYSPAYLTVGKNTYQKLPENVQKIIEAGAKEAQTWGYQEAEKRESELEKKLVESGMTLNNANIQAFIEASQPIYDEFISEVPNGKELLEKMKDTLK